MNFAFHESVAGNITVSADYGSTENICERPNLSSSTNRHPSLYQRLWMNKGGLISLGRSHVSFDTAALVWLNVQTLRKPRKYS
jgi:hypothetical protein